MFDGPVTSLGARIELCQEYSELRYPFAFVHLWNESKATEVSSRSGITQLFLALYPRSLSSLSSKINRMHHQLEPCL